MYRPGAGTVRQTRYQGMGDIPPDPHDLISMHAGSDQSKRQAQFSHIKALLKDAIRDEQDAIDKYAYILEELQTVSIRQPGRVCPKCGTHGYIDKGDYHNEPFFECSAGCGTFSIKQVPPLYDFLKDKEIIEHIKSQEAVHKALLERLLSRMQ